MKKYTKEYVLKVLKRQAKKHYKLFLVDHWFEEYGQNELV